MGFQLKEPFFFGNYKGSSKDNIEQLFRIISFLGIDDFLIYYFKIVDENRRWIYDYNLYKKQYNSLQLVLPNKRKSWVSFLQQQQQKQLDNRNYHYYPINDLKNGFNLLDKLLIYDHKERYTAKEAMEHCFFDDVRDEIEKELLLLLQKKQEEEEVVANNNGN